MSFDAQRMYELLPAIYRIRDAQSGEPLADEPALRTLGCRQHRW